MPAELPLRGTRASAICRYSFLTQTCPRTPTLGYSLRAHRPLRVWVCTQGVTRAGLVSPKTHPKLRTALLGQRSLRRLPSEPMSPCRPGSPALTNYNPQREAQRLAWGLCKQLNASPFMLLHNQPRTCLSPCKKLMLQRGCSSYSVSAFQLHPPPVAPCPAPSTTQPQPPRRCFSLPMASFSFTPRLLFHLTPASSEVH